MKRHYAYYRFILVMLFLLLIVACASAPGAGAPAEEPAAPEFTAPAEVEEPSAEEPMEEPAEEAPEEPMEEEPPAAPTLPPPTAAIALPTPSPAPTLTLAPGSPIIISEEPEQPQPAILESRRLTLEFPPVMRTGDSMRIRLQLEVDDKGNIVPTAIVEDNVVTSEAVEIPDLYDTHFVVAEAQLDMAGMEVQPSGIISEPLNRGQSVTFYWSVRPENSGKYEGTVLLHLRLTPKEDGAESRIPVRVLFLDIEAKSFLGFMSGGMARGVGALGSILGSVLGFPFVDDVVKWLWGRIRQK